MTIDHDSGLLNPIITPSKFNQSFLSSDIKNELNKSSQHKQHTASEPALMPSQEEKFTDSHNENLDANEISSPSDQKRRRLQCHSLDDIDPNEKYINGKKLKKNLFD